MLRDGWSCSHISHESIRIYNYIDQNLQQLARKWQKRKNGYLWLWGIGIEAGKGGDALRMGSQAIKTKTF